MLKIWFKKKFFPYVVNLQSDIIDIATHAINDPGHYVDV